MSRNLRKKGSVWYQGLNINNRLTWPWARNSTQTTHYQNAAAPDCFHPPLLPNWQKRQYNSVGIVSLPVPIWSAQTRLTSKSFTGPPIRVLVRDGPNKHTVPFFAHASAVCRWSNVLKTQFEQHQLATHVRNRARAQGVKVPLPLIESETSWQECTVYIPNCEPEIFELYLNWHYTERFPIPVELHHDESESESEGSDVGADGTDNGVGNDENNGGDNGPQTDWHAHAVQFLTKALLLGRWLHDECFQYELTRLIQQITGQLVIRYGG